MTPTSSPRVRDFTDRQRRLEAHVEVSPAYELVISLFAFEGEQEMGDLESGSKYFEFVREHASESLLSDLADLRSCGEVWLALIGTVHETPEPRTLDAFLAHLANSDPVALRRRILTSICMAPAKGFDPDLIEDAAASVAGSLDRLFGGEDDTDHRGLYRLLDRDPVETRDRLVDILMRFHDEVCAKGEMRIDVLERDAAEKRALGGTMSADRLVEQATNGVTFRMQPDVTGVLLIPSIVLRPWVVITEHDGLMIFVYPVSDEHLTADPDAPPSYLVDFYKALGDEKRLRVLSILAESDMGLGELADRLGLAKSTVHHHLRLLRSAGLVRVTIGEDKSYSLRTDTVPEAGRLLESFLEERSRRIARSGSTVTST